MLKLYPYHLGYLYHYDYPNMRKDSQFEKDTVEKNMCYFYKKKEFQKMQSELEHITKCNNIEFTPISGINDDVYCNYWAFKVTGFEQEFFLFKNRYDNMFACALNVYGGGFEYNMRYHFIEIEEFEEMVPSDWNIVSAAYLNKPFSIQEHLILYKYFTMSKKDYFDELEINSCSKQDFVITLRDYLETCLGLIPLNEENNGFILFNTYYV